MILKEDAYRLAAINAADEWLAEHRVTESWRMINRLRDQLVRSSPKPVDVEVVNRLLHKYDNDPNFGVREFTDELREMLA